VKLQFPDTLFEISCEESIVLTVYRNSSLDVASLG
jgi:hypothetical protein